MRKRIAIVGSGPVGTTMAYHLTQKGYPVDIFEKGPNIPYPHTDQFTHKMLYLKENQSYKAPKDLKNHTLSGDYLHHIESERVMGVGGSGTHWTANTPRMHPNDFKTKTLFGYGEDWPISYDELEPYYCKAEEFIGVSGTDSDNPFAPWRSKPYPLPPFELSSDDKTMAERLKSDDIVLHTTPNARTRKPYDGRDACVNFGTCRVCPMGARYSPNHHLNRAISKGLCKLHSNVSVKRIIIGESGTKIKGLVYQQNNDSQEKEHAADVIIIAAGAIESTRLLLLSKYDQHPDGIGNTSGFLGKNFTFHHLWRGQLHYREKLYPGRIGAQTGQTHQFINTKSRGNHCAIKIEFSSNPQFPPVPTQWGSKNEILSQLQDTLHRRTITFHSETTPTSEKYITLSQKRDRFHDPFAHINYNSSALDYETYKFSKSILKRFVKATKADDIKFDDYSFYDSGAHHMGGCKMGFTLKDSVVDKFGKVHGFSNLFVLGGSNFVGSSGAANPTLTMIALSILSSEFMLDQLL